ncbi:hypothetical protein ACLB2K_053626 [Fragaria x ananassa]
MTGEFVNQGPAMLHQQQATLHPQQFNAAYSLPTPSGSYTRHHRFTPMVLYLLSCIKLCHRKSVSMRKYIVHQEYMRFKELSKMNNVNVVTFLFPMFFEFRSQLNEIRAVDGVFHLRWTNRLPNGAAHSRPLQHQRGREAEFIPSTQVLESSMVERAQPPDDGQMIQAQEMPSVLHPHQSNQDSSAIASRPQEVGGSQHQLTTHVQIVPNVVANSMVPTPSMLPRFPSVQLEELTAGINSTPTDGNSQQGMPEKRACKRRVSSAQGYEPEESSKVSSKRQRNSTNSNDQEAFVPFIPREVINGCYNPIYIEMGLPLDPHLQMLEASLKMEFPPE